MARRRCELDLGELEKLATLHCTQAEAASFFAVSLKTMQRRLSERRYREAWERGQAKGRITLRRAQFQLAAKGNATMLIWLGKQLLEQRDLPVDKADTEKSAIVELVERLRAEHGPVPPPKLLPASRPEAQDRPAAAGKDVGSASASVAPSSREAS